MIFSKTIEQHIDNVFKVLSPVYNAGATSKVKNCNFFTDTIDYLGHVICSRRLELGAQTTVTIHDFKPPSSLNKLRSFLGL